ncbi:MAG: calcium-binding protein [Prochloraceae cyanobacterium]|nr:calcium-binding protein [Prochloraceae cyanobacterium]
MNVQKRERISNDYLEEESGNDYLNGGDGHDRLHGGDQHDRLYGELGNDKFYGDNGNDRISGGDGYDILNGGDGHDTLYGDSGNDTLIGGSGNDSLNGGGNYGGYDELTSGNVNNIDRFILGDSRGSYYKGNGYATITDFDNDNKGFADKIVLYGSPSNYRTVRTSVGTDIYLAGTNDLIASVDTIYNGAINLNLSISLQYL